MELQINSVTVNGSHKFVEATCGKTKASVSFSDFGVRVCVYNASHQVWRGAGKAFATLADAKAGYKSAAMQSILDAAAEVVQ